MCLGIGHPKIHFFKAHPNICIKSPYSHTMMWIYSLRDFHNNSYRYHTNHKGWETPRLSEAKPLVGHHGPTDGFSWPPRTGQVLAATAQFEGAQGTSCSKWSTPDSGQKQVTYTILDVLFQASLSWPIVHNDFGINAAMRLMLTKMRPPNDKLTNTKHHVSGASPAPSDLPSGNDYSNSLLLKMTIYSGFTHWKWWFSI